MIGCPTQEDHLSSTGIQLRNAAQLTTAGAVSATQTGDDADQNGKSK